MNKHETWKFLKNTKATNLLVFVHGLIGSSKTWFENHDDTIVDFILKDKEICSHYDVALFSYYTTLTDFFVKKTYWFKRILLGNKSNVHKSNLEISSISDLLESDLRYRSKDYEKVILIGHSMGGLVCKSFLLKNLELKTINNINGLITLATPHRGANLAILGNSILNNPQLKNLEPLNSFLLSTNDNWVINKEGLPRALYFYGKNDEVVAEVAAKPTENIKGHEVVATNDDHSSIIKPNDKDDKVLLALREFVLNKNEELPDIPPLIFEFGADTEEGEVTLEFLPESLSIHKMNYIRRRAEKGITPLFELEKRINLSNIESHWDKKAANDVINDLLMQISLKLEILFVTNHMLISVHPSILNIVTNITQRIRRKNRGDKTTKLDVFLENPRISFGIYLSDKEMIESANTNTFEEAMVFFRGSVFMGFDIDNFRTSILENKVIPSYVDEIYNQIQKETITFNDFNWNYLGAYKVGLG